MAIYFLNLIYKYILDACSDYTVHQPNEPWSMDSWPNVCSGGIPTAFSIVPGDRDTSPLVMAAEYTSI